MMEALKKALQEMVVPELEPVRAENAEIKVTLHLTNRRLQEGRKARLPTGSRSRSCLKKQTENQSVGVCFLREAKPVRFFSLVYQFVQKLPDDLS